MIEIIIELLENIIFNIEHGGASTEQVLETLESLIERLKGEY